MKIVHCVNKMSLYRCIIKRKSSENLSEIRLKNASHIIQQRQDGQGKSWPSPWAIPPHSYRKLSKGFKCQDMTL